MFYTALVLAPMLIVVIGDRPAPRNLLVESGAMLGLLGLGVLAMQLVISGRHRWFAGSLGQDNVLQFHRQVGIFGWLLVLAHPLCMLFGNPEYLAFLDPRAGWLRAITLYLLLLATTALILSSLWRVHFRLQYEWWRALHAALALLVVSGGLGHALMADHYTAGWLTKALLGGLIGVPLLLLLETRLLRPLRLRQRPWKVTTVEQRSGDVTRLVLHADGHGGMRFLPGQFVWLTLGETPCTLQQHPFSITSPATEPDRIELAIKPLGDFTRSVADLACGTPAWLEGPYGTFSIDASSGRRAVFIAGGIGVTPIISMLRTCRERGCKQPMWLVDANDKQSEIIFRNEIESLAQRMSLQVVHVLVDPPPEWRGETGYVDEALLERVLPPDADDIDYFVCGPPPMMDSVEPALRARGVAADRLHSERFELV
jgi:predicted ferric reductase